MEENQGVTSAGLSKVVPAGGAGKQTIVTDAVEPSRHDVKQEATDELVGGKRHDLLPLGIVTSVVLVAKGDALFVEGDEASVRDGDAVRVSRQVGKHGLRSSEWRLGVDDPAGFPGRSEMLVESAPVGERCERTEESELPASRS